MTQKKKVALFSAHYQLLDMTTPKRKKTASIISQVRTTSHPRHFSVGCSNKKKTYYNIVERGEEEAMNMR